MDIHILAQGIVYFCMFIAGLAMSVTIGVNRVGFSFSVFYLSQVYSATHIYIHLNPIKTARPDRRHVKHTTCLSVCGQFVNRAQYRENPN